MLTSNEHGVESIASYGQFRKLISMENIVLECNLRMIESYLPEILFYIGKEDIKDKNIYEIIKLCSNKKFPFPSVSNSKRFLEFKMFYLFEAILFGEIFKTVWKGQWQNRNFVIKRKASLEYYQMYNTRELISLLFNIISIYASRNRREIKMQFVLLENYNI